MSKVLELLLKYLGLPLLEKLGKYLFDLAHNWYEEQKMKKEINKKIKELKKDGKSKEEVRDILRDIAP